MRQELKSHLLIYPLLRNLSHDFLQWLASDLSEICPDFFGETSLAGCSAERLAIAILSGFIKNSQKEIPNEELIDIEDILGIAYAYHISLAHISVNRRLLFPYRELLPPTPPLNYADQVIAIYRQYSIDRVAQEVKSERARTRSASIYAFDRYAFLYNQEKNITPNYELFFRFAGHKWIEKMYHSAKNNAEPIIDIIPIYDGNNEFNSSIHYNGFDAAELHDDSERIESHKEDVNKRLEKGNRFIWKGNPKIAPHPKSLEKKFKHILRRIWFPLPSGELVIEENEQGYFECSFFDVEDETLYVYIDIKESTSSFLINEEVYRKSVEEWYYILYIAQLTLSKRIGQRKASSLSRRSLRPSSFPVPSVIEKWFSNVWKCNLRDENAGERIIKALAELKTEDKIRSSIRKYIGKAYSCTEKRGGKKVEEYIEDIIFNCGRGMLYDDLILAHPGEDIVKSGKFMGTVRLTFIVRNKLNSTYQSTFDINEKGILPSPNLLRSIPEVNSPGRLSIENAVILRIESGECGIPNRKPKAERDRYPKCNLLQFITEHGSLCAARKDWFFVFNKEEISNFYLTTNNAHEIQRIMDDRYPFEWCELDLVHQICVNPLRVSSAYMITPYMSTALEIPGIVLARHVSSLIEKNGVRKKRGCQRMPVQITDNLFLVAADRGLKIHMYTGDKSVINDHIDRLDIPSPSTNVVLTIFRDKEYIQGNVVVGFIGDFLDLNAAEKSFNWNVLPKYVEKAYSSDKVKFPKFDGRGDGWRRLVIIIYVDAKEKYKWRNSALSVYFRPANEQNCPYNPKTRPLTKMPPIPLISLYGMQDKRGKRGMLTPMGKALYGISALTKDEEVLSSGIKKLKEYEKALRNKRNRNLIISDLREVLMPELSDSKDDIVKATLRLLCESGRKMRERLTHILAGYLGLGFSGAFEAGVPRFSTIRVKKTDAAIREESIETLPQKIKNQLS